MTARADALQAADRVRCGRCTMHRGRHFDKSRVRDLRRVAMRDIGSTLEEAA